MFENIGKCSKEDSKDSTCRIEYVKKNEQEHFDHAPTDA